MEDTMDPPAAHPAAAPPSRAAALAALTAEGPFQLVEEPAPGGPPLRVYAHAPASLRAVLESTAAFGERPFLIYADETVTYAQHLARAASLARHLAGQGVRKGDRVAIGMRNYPEWSVAFWACQAIGAVVVALNAWWTTAELAFALEDSEPVALVIDGERLDRVRPLLGQHAASSLLVTRRGDAGPGGVDLDEILEDATRPCLRRRSIRRISPRSSTPQGPPACRRAPWPPSATTSPT